MEKILLLIQDYPSLGGIASVSESLAEALTAEGYLVEWMALRSSEAATSVKSPVFPFRYLPDASDANSPVNRSFLKAYIEENDIRYLLDQGAWTFLYSDFAGSDRHFYIRVFHLDPDWLLYRHRMNRKCSSGSALQNTGKPFFKRPKAWLRSWLTHFPLWNRLRVRAQLRDCLRDSAAVVVLTRAYRDKLLKIAGLSEKSEEAGKILVIGNPVRPLAFPEDNPSAQRALLYAGRFSRADKRLERLIAAWARLEPAWPEWKLILRGAGPDERRLRRLVGKRQLQNVCFEPPCAPEALYENASVYCLTSFCEGFNLSLLEAQQRGLVPVVAYASGYEYEAVSEGVSGRVVASRFTRQGRLKSPEYHSFNARTYADALAALMSDETRRREMSVEARLWASRFPMASFLPLWKTLLENLARQASAPVDSDERTPMEEDSGLNTDAQSLDASEERIQVLISTCGSRVARMETLLPEPRPEVRYCVSWQSLGEKLPGIPSGTEPDVPAKASSPEKVESARAAKTNGILWFERQDVCWEATGSTGISANRNHSLRMVCRQTGLQPSLSWILDDDVRILPGAYQRIRAAFHRHPEVDVACFQIVTPEGAPYHPYPESECELHTLNDLRRFSSIEIVFRTERILAAGLSFDERFGLGRPWPCSEEFLFLAACLRAGLHLHYFPYPIVEHPANSTTKSRSPYQDALLRKSGAVNTLLFGRPWAYLRNLLSLLKARPALRKEKISVWHFLRMKNLGSREA